MREVEKAAENEKMQKQTHEKWKWKWNANMTLGQDRTVMNAEILSVARAAHLLQC